MNPVDFIYQDHRRRLRRFSYAGAALCALIFIFHARSRGVVGLLDVSFLKLFLLPFVALAVFCSPTRGRTKNALERELQKRSLGTPEDRSTMLALDFELSDPTLRNLVSRYKRQLCLGAFLGGFVVVLLTPALIGMLIAIGRQLSSTL